MRFAKRHDGAEYVIAADHHDLVDPCLLRGPAGMRKPLLQAARHDGARRNEARLARKHDVEPVIEDAGKRLEGAAAHEDRLAERDFAELLEIGGEPPGEIAADADGAVLSPRHDEGNDGIARRSRRVAAHTATLAWMAGCGS